MDIKMEKLTPDALLYVGLDLDLPDLLRLCQTNSEINNKLCIKERLWLEKIKRDFPEFKDRKLDNTPNNPKDLYILLWSLSDLKTQLNLEGDIYNLYSSKVLDLSNKSLTKLPSSIRFLTNLQELNIANNQLKKLPNQLPNSLQKLNLSYNQLTELPNNLPNSLQYLSVENNKLTKFPDYLPPFLLFIDIENNHLKKLPLRLPNSLNYLFLENNQIPKDDIDRIKTLYPKLKVYHKN